MATTLDPPTPERNRTPRVVLHRVSKSFGSTRALADVSVTGQAGSIHAVTGENGAGKSTLMKLLAGVYRPDAGEIRLNGQVVRLQGPAQARALGVSTVFQELTVLPNLSVAENLWLGREPRAGASVDRRALRRMAGEVLERTRIPLDPDRACATLSIGEQQLLEIAKGLAGEAEVFIFDEPTAPLNRAEVDQLEALLWDLKARGKLVFYISHRMEEMFRFCDTATVLKDGQHVATEPMASLTPDRLVALMVGRELHSLFPSRRNAPAHDVVLAARGLVTQPGTVPVDLVLRRGEIVGLAGLEGQGQREILRTLAGAAAPVCGDVQVSDPGGTARRLGPRPTPGQAVRHGIALMPEDRKTEGLYLDLSIEDNLWLGSLRGRALWRLARRDPVLAASLCERMRMRSHPKVAVGSLSGGNQQKVMLGRWLAAGVQVLLVEQPTRGVDVGAKAEIYQLLRQFVDAGGAVLAVSGDLPELIGLCDRILVVRQGGIVADVPAGQATEEGLLGLALLDATAAVGRP